MIYGIKKDRRATTQAVSPILYITRKGQYQITWSLYHKEGEMSNEKL